MLQAKARKPCIVKTLCSTLYGDHEIHTVIVGLRPDLLRTLRDSSKARAIFEVERACVHLPQSFGIRYEQTAKPKSLLYIDLLAPIKSSAGGVIKSRRTDQPDCYLACVN
jgi:hypothetical protein